MKEVNEKSKMINIKKEIKHLGFLIGKILNKKTITQYIDNGFDDYFSLNVPTKGFFETITYNRQICHIDYDLRNNYKYVIVLDIYRYYEAVKKGIKELEKIYNIKCKYYIPEDIN